MLVENAYVGSGLEECACCGESMPFEALFATAPTRRPQFLFRLSDIEDSMESTADGGDSLEGAIDPGQTSLSTSTGAPDPSDAFMRELFDPNVVDKVSGVVRPAFANSFTFTEDSKPELCCTDCLEKLPPASDADADAGGLPGSDLPPTPTETLEEPPTTETPEMPTTSVTPDVPPTKVTPEEPSTKETPEPPTMGSVSLPDG